MDWGKTLLKGLAAVGHYLVALLITALLAALAGLTPQAITDALMGAGLPAFVVSALVPFVLAGIVMLQNYLKNRNKPAPSV